MEGRRWPTKQDKCLTNTSLENTLKGCNIFFAFFFLFAFPFSLKVFSFLFFFYSLSLKGWTTHLRVILKTDQIAFFECFQVSTDQERREKKSENTKLTFIVCNCSLRVNVDLFALLRDLSGSRLGAYKSIVFYNFRNVWNGAIIGMPRYFMFLKKSVVSLVREQKVEEKKTIRNIIVSSPLFLRFWKNISIENVRLQKTTKVDIW